MCLGRNGWGKVDMVGYRYTWLAYATHVPLTLSLSLPHHVFRKERLGKRGYGWLPLYLVGYRYTWLATLHMFP